MTTPERVDVGALRQVAEAATPGPWGVTQDEDSGARMVFSGDIHLCDVSEWSRWLGNAAYIAAANPATMLALLDEVEALRAAVGRVRNVEHYFREEYAHQFVGAERVAERIRAALDAGEVGDHPPCCSACGGKGGTYSGPCWDCRGTGHPHPMEAS